MLKITKVKKEETGQVLKLIHEVYREIPEKSWFSLDGDEELLAYMTENGFALKAVEENKMAAIFVARTTNLGKENLGEYLKLAPEEMQKVAHMEIAMVRNAYRGKGLQKQMMQEAETRLKEAGYQYLMGTAHPENVYSVNNFKQLGYENVAEVLKYGGLPRYVFCKKIFV